MNSYAKLHVDANSPSTLQAKTYLESNFGHQIHAEHTSLARRDPALLVCVDESHTSGRNVIMENFFTSLCRTNKIIANETSLQRTTSKMRQELSPSVKANMLR